MSQLRKLFQPFRLHEYAEILCVALLDLFQKECRKAVPGCNSLSEPSLSLKQNSGQKFRTHCSKQKVRIQVINHLSLEIQMDLKILPVISMILYPATQFQLQAQHLFKMQRRFVNIKVFHSLLSKTCS